MNKRLKKLSGWDKLVKAYLGSRSGSGKRLRKAKNIRSAKRLARRRNRRK